MVSMDHIAWTLPSPAFFALHNSLATVCLYVASRGPRRPHPLAVEYCIHCFVIMILLYISSEGVVSTIMSNCLIALYMSLYFFCFPFFNKVNKVYILKNFLKKTNVIPKFKTLPMNDSYVFGQKNWFLCRKLWTNKMIVFMEHVFVIYQPLKLQSISKCIAWVGLGRYIDKKSTARGQKVSKKYHFLSPWFARQWNEAALYATVGSFGRIPWWVKRVVGLALGLVFGKTVLHYARVAFRQQPAAVGRAATVRQRVMIPIWMTWSTSAITTASRSSPNRSWCGRT